MHVGSRRIAGACALLMLGLLLVVSCGDDTLPLESLEDAGSLEEAGSLEVAPLVDSGQRSDSEAGNVPDAQELSVCDAPSDGFAHNTPPIVHGCHPDLFVPQECKTDVRPPPCVPPPDGALGVTVSNPEDLPCGSCSDPGYRCVMWVRPLCDCDGDGPQEPFLEPHPDYTDDWHCLCLGGTWKCMVDSVTGDDCSVCNTDPSL
jgi:hypothetical protein